MPKATPSEIETDHPPRPGRQISGRALLTCVTASILIFLAVIPESLLDRLPYHCPYFLLSGRRCLGCGATHGLWKALHGDWHGALQANTLTPLYLLTLAGLLLGGLLYLVRSRLPAALQLRSYEFRLAVLAAWEVVSLAVAVVAGFAWQAPEDALFAVAKACEIPGGHQKPCFLCGMTHAFVATREGDYAGALEANEHSLALFSLLGANEALAFLVLIRALTRWLLHRNAVTGSTSRMTNDRRPAC